jgi:hypothetical protein
MPLDGPTEVSLEWMRVKDVDELLALPTVEMARRIADAPFPPSEKLIGAVVAVAVDRLRSATDDLARSSTAMDDKTRALVRIASLTLAVAFVSLVVAVVAAVR